MYRVADPYPALCATFPHEMEKGEETRLREPREVPIFARLLFWGEWFCRGVQNVA